MAGGKSLAEVKIQRGIFQGNELSPLLFEIAMMSLNHILKKWTGGYKLRKGQSPNVHGRHQTICQKWKRIRNPYIGNENIQSGHRDGIWHRKMSHANIEKRETTQDGRNWTTKSRKNLNSRRKRNSQILGNIGSSNHQTSGDERKNQNEYLEEREKLHETKIYCHNLINGINN